MTLLSDIDQRSRDILAKVVTAYLDSGEPVGSRTLTNSGINLSAATIRNVMADLTDLGLLYAPHVSAGRLPTEKGLRLFVDGMLQIGDLTAEERSALEEEAGSAARADEVLDNAAARLSGLARTASLVLAGKKEGVLKHIEFLRISDTQGLVIMVMDDDDVENRLINLPTGLPASALTEAANYLNARLAGRSIADARRLILSELETGQAELDQLTGELVKAGVAEVGPGGTNLIIRGQANLLSQDHAEDLDRVRLLFEDIERKQGLIDLLEAAGDGDGVRIFIGSENQLFSLSGSSVIVKPYRDGNEKIVGVVGVIGPTRLNYGRIIPMVDYTADMVTRLIK